MEEVNTMRRRWKHYWGAQDRIRIILVPSCATMTRPMPHRPACEQAFTSKYCVNELAAASRTPESISECGWQAGPPGAAVVFNVLID
jgi:hypothetical protein